MPQGSASTCKSSAWSTGVPQRSHEIAPIDLHSDIYKTTMAEMLESHGKSFFHCHRLAQPLSGLYVLSSFFCFNALQGPLLRARTRVARCSRDGHGTGRGGPRVSGGEEGLGPSCCSASVIMGLPWDYSGLMGCHVHEHVWDNYNIITYKHMICMCVCKWSIHNPFPLIFNTPRKHGLVANLTPKIPDG